MILFHWQGPEGSLVRGGVVQHWEENGKRLVLRSPAHTRALEGCILALWSLGSATCSVSVVVWLEGPISGQAQVFGLFVTQLRQLHTQLVQMSSSHSFIQLENKTLRLRILREQSPLSSGRHSPEGEMSMWKPTAAPRGTYTDTALFLPASLTCLSTDLHSDGRALCFWGSQV